MVGGLGEHVQAGRDLDALVAEKVIGISRHLIASSMEPGAKCAIYSLPHYSTDIAAAMAVITHVMKSYRSKVSIETYDGEIWSIKPCGTSSNSLPHAICLAALKAIGYEPEV
jgi:hypothetical protein